MYMRLMTDRTEREALEVSRYCHAIGVCTPRSYAAMSVLDWYVADTLCRFSAATQEQLVMIAEIIETSYVKDEF